MLDVLDMERLRVLAGRADRGVITSAEKGELRGILAKATPTAWDFSWPDLMDVALMFIGVYSIGRLGAEAAAADAS